MSVNPHRHRTRTIEIKLEVPRLEKIERVQAKSAATLRRAWRKRLFRISIAALLVLVAAIATVLILTSHKKGDELGAKKLTEISEAEKKALAPQFTTVLPTGKTIESLGGWTRVSPVDRNAVFAYTDYINNNRIVVSQQPMPESFIGDVDQQVAELAAGYKATEKLTAAGQIVYIGTSAKGPQSLIFAKNDLLLLIKSSVKLSNDEWLQYITGLQ